MDYEPNLDTTGGGVSSLQASRRSSVDENPVRWEVSVSFKTFNCAASALLLFFFTDSSAGGTMTLKGD